MDTTNPVDIYSQRVEEIKSLAGKVGEHKWRIGDLINECECEVSQVLDGVDKHLLIGAHIPNFWKQLSDEVGLSVSQLKNYAEVARQFPPDKRRKELTWSHHLIAAAYDDKDVYLHRCISDGMEEIGKPHSVRWLESYIEQQEDCVRDPIEEKETVSVKLPLWMVRRLNDLSKGYYRKPIGEIISDHIRPAVEAFLKSEGERISLQFFNVYEEGVWPFEPLARKKLGAKRRKPAPFKVERVGDSRTYRWTAN